ncbi:hypothetical protein DDB_G0279469 [Dictyostelium discoideum AX4]|uniref:Uncharacterized protein n=1 Tax=Dictyostelium discoideum TaxID=44689 RepID=Q54WS3_DICDI|nr:hypothetical protein DDB_G0279469 [Dictyostelium discoideum AX4]EAL67673.1 hypothetical protein DDB_G0279469 [Dictyostelium discoideum AX4]|eukprot:XP_641644.1 hypothetical protein DDB_G0279469 [Dictyostelium discoideum AX4]
MFRYHLRCLPVNYPNHEDWTLSHFFFNCKKTLDFIPILSI